MHLRPATLRDQRNCVENITTSTASCTCSEVLGLGLMLSESPDLSSGAVQRESVQISQKFCLPRPVHSSGAVQQRESVQISQQFCSILWRFMGHVCGPRFAFVFATVSLPSQKASASASDWCIWCFHIFLTADLYSIAPRIPPGQLYSIAPRIPPGQARSSSSPSPSPSQPQSSRHRSAPAQNQLRASSGTLSWRYYNWDYSDCVQHMCAACFSSTSS